MTRRDGVLAAVLGAFSVAVTLWQNARLTVLWDVSYILENAWRIACGQVPYRDFPFPYAPLTFVTQAALIRLFGRHFFVPIIYATAIGGIATALTFLFLRRILGEAVEQPRLTAFLLTLPLAFLGVYDIFPHPFYDPDACLVVLVFLALLLRLDKAPSRTLAVVAGVVCAGSLFVKQNIGLGLIASSLVALTILAISRREMRRTALFIGAGLFSGLASALAIVQLTAGVPNWIAWTMRFAAQRRLPPIHRMVEIFDTPLLAWWIPLVALGVVALHFLGERTWGRWLAVALIASPFLTLAITWRSESDDFVFRFLSLWPLFLILSAVAAARDLVRERSFRTVMPFILIGTIGGTFLSQAVWGSTYGIWPFFIILVAVTLGAFASIDRRVVLPVAIVAASILLASGWRYVSESDRLTYAKVDERPIRHSSLPALRGLSMGGDWLPDFEELVAWSHKTIPRNATIAMLPGEDLFYYTTGRIPRFSVLMFDQTVNPYSVEQLDHLFESRHVEWIIVKKDLQIEGRPYSALDELLDRVSNRYEEVEDLNNYTIYRSTGSAVRQ